MPVSGAYCFVSLDILVPSFKIVSQIIHTQTLEQKPKQKKSHTHTRDMFERDLKLSHIAYLLSTFCFCFNTSTSASENFITAKSNKPNEKLKRNNHIL